MRRVRTQKCRRGDIPDRHDARMDQHADRKLLEDGFSLVARSGVAATAARAQFHVVRNVAVARDTLERVG